MYRVWVCLGLKNRPGMVSSTPPGRCHCNAIEAGGTTLRDFVNSEGNPGYFKQRLFVYGREGLFCRTCGKRIKHRVMGQRATYWCPGCQK